MRSVWGSLALHLMQHAGHVYHNKGSIQHLEYTIEQGEAAPAAEQHASTVSHYSVKALPSVNLLNNHLVTIPC